MRGTHRARDLRKSQTDAEAKLWFRLRNRGLGGFKFRRQYPLGRYIVDFICLEAQVVVEPDGGQHIDDAIHDEFRTTFLESLGLKVVRYWDDDVLLHTDEVLEHLLSRMPGPLTPTLSPQAGRGSDEP